MANSGVTEAKAEAKTEAKTEACTFPSSTPEESAPTTSTLVGTAMQHINEMTFRFGQTNAEVGRAKAMTAACLEALKPQIAQTLQPFMHDGVEVDSLVDPLVSVFDQVASRSGEQSERRQETARTYPPLRPHPRSLGERPAAQGKRKSIEGVIAYAYDFNLDELLEREVHYNPAFISDIILSCEYWTRRAREIKAMDNQHPDRLFEDLCDGDVWQAHEVLGDPSYEGPSRIPFQAYCDDVDIPNAIGTAAGHHKLYIQTVTCVSRNPRSRMTMRAQWLQTVCLSSDFKIFGPQAVISGAGALSQALGAQMRRLWTRGVLRLPPQCGRELFPFRAFLVVWCADGMAMGDVCGTNTSFSKAVNPCNTCEDLDQRVAAHKMPCSFLRCLCGNASSHKPGCPCRFRMRTPSRDLVRPTPTKAQMQALGLTTLNHGLSGIPGIHVAKPGPKDPMHTLNEGRTAQLAAVTLWHVAKSGWATSEALQQRASTFDWTPGQVSGFFRPNYLPAKIFVSTKVEMPNRSFVWGPHKDIKIPGSAAGMATYVLMWREFLRPFLPEFDSTESFPDWLLAWHLHAVAVQMSLRYRYTYAELLALENLFIRSEQLICDIPEYRDLWIPKAHWVLHLAHDIKDYGPTRLLTTFLNEMKNAKFKNGAKRGNYKNPVQDVALFWAEQSDYELQTLPVSPAVSSIDSKVLISGTAQTFHDSNAVRLLLDHGAITTASELDFLLSLRIHGVLLQREDYILLDSQVYTAERLVRHGAGQAHYILLRAHAEHLSVDALGAYYVPRGCTAEPELRIASLESCKLTCLWATAVDDVLYCVPKI